MKHKGIIDQIKDNPFEGLKADQVDLKEQDLIDFLEDLQKAVPVNTGKYYYRINLDYCFNLSIELFKKDRQIATLPYLYIYKFIGSGKFYLFKRLTDNIITVKGKQGYKCYCIGYEIRIFWMLIKIKTLLPSLGNSCFGLSNKDFK